MVSHHSGSYTWDGVEVHPYKEDGGTHFKNVTRQTLFQGGGNLDVEWRYFEIGQDGHSTFEFHEHEHLVTVVRGKGQVLIGDKISDVGPLDIIHIPSNTWHQFRANQGDVLGFLCLVNNDRDRPRRPTEEELVELKANATIADFIRI